MKIRNATFKNIRGTSGTQEGVAIVCSSGITCENVKLRDINLRFDGIMTTARCANVKPTIGGKTPTCAAHEAKN